VVPEGRAADDFGRAQDQIVGLMTQFSGSLVSGLRSALGAAQDAVTRAIGEFNLSAAALTIPQLAESGIVTDSAVGTDAAIPMSRNGSDRPIVVYVTTNLDGKQVARSITPWLPEEVRTMRLAP
jgi:hypothetical protein